MEVKIRSRFYCGLVSKDGHPVSVENYHEALRQGGYPSYTVYKAQGCWMGDREESVVIEIITNNSEMCFDLARCLAERLRIAGGQSAVLLTREEVATALVC